MTPMNKTFLYIFSSCFCLAFLYYYQFQKNFQPSFIKKNFKKPRSGQNYSSVHARQFQIKRNRAEFDKSSFTQSFIQTLYYSNNGSLNSDRFLHLTEKGLDLFNFYRGQKREFFSDFQSSLEKKLELQKKCRQMNFDPVIDLSRMVFDDRHKVVMCVVPKAACTTWKSFMWHLQGKIKNKEELDELLKTKASSFKLEPYGDTKTMRSLSEEEAIRRLLTYTTFLVARHPFERLVSAFSSKFTDRSMSDRYFTILGKPIALAQADQYLKNASFSNTKSGYEIVRNRVFHKLPEDERNKVLNYIDVMNSGKISFTQFIKFVLDTKQSGYEHDVHWRPHAALCNPCVLNYDYVIRFEHLAEDSNRLLKYLQKYDQENERLFFDSKLSSKINSNRTVAAFSNMNNSTIKALQELYADDFKLFDFKSNLINDLI